MKEILFNTELLSDFDIYLAFLLSGVESTAPPVSYWSPI